MLQLQGNNIFKMDYIANSTCANKRACRSLQEKHFLLKAKKLTAATVCIGE